jgi:adenylate cyclase
MALFAGALSVTPIAHRLDNRYGLGALYWFRGPIAAPDYAVVAAIDRSTINWLRDIEDNPQYGGEELLSCLPTSAREELSKIRGPSSLPRSVFGCMVRQLEELGFPVVAFDILFAVEGGQEDDENLAEAIKQHGAVVLLVGLERSTFEEHQVQPAERFTEHAAATGAFIVSRTEGPVYGYWRRFPGFETMQSMPDAVTQLFRRDAVPEGLEEGEKPQFEYFWQYGPPGWIKTIPIRDILTGELPASVRDTASETAAFVGASDPDMTNFIDSFPSMVPSDSGAWIGGVELAATAFLNLNEREHLRPLSSMSALALTVVFGFVVGFLMRARVSLAMFAVPAAAAVYAVAAAVVFSRFRLFLPIAAPIFLFAPTAFALAVFLRYRFARAFLMRIAPAPIVRRMLSRAAVDRSGETVAGEATVLFCDLIGSTTIGEQLPAAQFSALLNQFHERLTGAIEKHRGTVVDFRGDGLMAAFSLADAGRDHAARACRSAVLAVSELRKMNDANLRRGLPALHMRIGINTGDVAEGEVGGHDRFNFTIVGDAVNLGARLEEMGKSLFPLETEVILVGQKTRASAQERDIAFMDCGEQVIRGRDAPEHVYRIDTSD